DELRSFFTRPRHRQGNEPRPEKEDAMSTGTLIFLLLIVGAPLLMVLMHRGGGRAHGGMGGGGCGGGHGGYSSDERQEPSQKDKKPLLGKPGTHAHGTEPAAASGGKHR